MRISVAMCTYNGEQFLNAQLESIVSQSQLPYELVVCDDGSTDTTIEILRRFAATAPFSVRIICNPINLGSTKNFEQAIELCSGDLIALCDQDDVWRSNKLAQLSATFSLDKTIGGIFSNAELIDSESKFLERNLWRSVRFFPKTLNTSDETQMIRTLLKFNVVTGATLMIRADLRKQILPIPSSWIHDAWIAFMLAIYSKIIALDESLICYRIHDSQQLGVKVAPIRKRVQKKYQQIRLVQLEAARLHLQQNPSEKQSVIAENLNQAIQHMRMRSQLSRNIILRIYHIAHSLPDYYRYSNGIASVCKDLFFPPELCS